MAFLIVWSSSGVILAQEAGDSEGRLSEQYRELMDRSETYEKYKVIAITKLDEFWAGVEDSLGLYRSQIADAKRQVARANETLQQAKDSLAVVNKQLAASEEENDGIYFLGMLLDKSFYNVLVWGIVGGLLVLLGVLYVSFKTSHQITSRAKKDLQQVSAELENLRHRSNEKQVKLKRELQTALNQIEEYKRKVPAGR